MRVTEQLPLIFFNHHRPVVQSGNKIVIVANVHLLEA